MSISSPVRYSTVFRIFEMYIILKRFVILCNVYKQSEPLPLGETKRNRLIFYTTSTLSQKVRKNLNPFYRLESHRVDALISLGSNYKKNFTIVLG